MKNIFLKVLLVPCCLLIICGCSSQKKLSRPAFKDAPLFGMVYDYEGHPLLGVRMIFDSYGGPSSDINGRFILADVEYGPHAIILQKHGYESVNLIFSFIDKTQVLYIKLASFDQLIRKAEEHIKRKEWEEAKRTIRRAGSVDRQNPELRYLTAILHYKLDDFTEAERILLNLLTDGEYREPYIHLLLADIYQYKKEMPDKAVDQLELFLELKYDEAVQDRLSELVQSYNS